MIDILLAVYNSEKYIEDQIRSILAQTSGNWNLLIRDDGSTDGTSNILKTYALKYPSKIFLYGAEKNSKDPVKNFFELMKLSKHKYIMFCDHDDVWETTKIEKSYRKILDMEKSSPGIPLLVHTDAKVVDQNLNIINESLFKFQNLSYKTNKLNNLLAQNIVTGCTVITNKELLDKALEYKHGAIMHDWWLALVACCFGKIGFLPNKTVLYRQHQNNKIGAKNNSSLNYNLNRLKNKDNAKTVLDATYNQAKAFLESYMDELSEKQKKLIKAYTEIPTLSKVKKIMTLFKYNFFKNGLKRKLGQILFV